MKGKYGGTGLGMCQNNILILNNWEWQKQIIFKRSFCHFIPFWILCSTRRTSYAPCLYYTRHHSQTHITHIWPGPLPPSLSTPRYLSPRLRSSLSFSGTSSSTPIFSVMWNFVQLGTEILQQMSYNQKPTSPGTFIFKRNFISVSGYTERRDFI